jgi:hypothetical protein
VRKIAVLLFLSVLVSSINAATMPIAFGQGDVVLSPSSSHDYCHETAVSDTAENGTTKTKIGSSHYCCSVVAVLVSTIFIYWPTQSTYHLTSQFSIPISNITESIYKPPKLYL